MSWRDAASPAARDDLDSLFAQAPGFAVHMLGQAGEFLPYAAHLSTEGEVGLMAADNELLGDNPTSLAVIETLEDVLGVNNARLRASAIVYDVTTASGDALAVKLEHREGIAIRIVVPYTRGEDGVHLAAPAGADPFEAAVFR